MLKKVREVLPTPVAWDFGWSQATSGISQLLTKKRQRLV